MLVNLYICLWHSFLNCNFRTILHKPHMNIWSYESRIKRIWSYEHMAWLLQCTYHKNWNFMYTISFFLNENQSFLKISILLKKKIFFFSIWLMNLAKQGNSDMLFFCLTEIVGIDSVFSLFFFFVFLSSLSHPLCSV